MRIQLKVDGNIVMDVDSRQFIYDLALQGHPVRLAPGTQIETVCSTATHTIRDIQTIPDDDDAYED